MKASQLPIIRKAMPLLKDTPDNIPVNTYHSNNESLPLLRLRYNQWPLVSANRPNSERDNDNNEQYRSNTDLILVH